MQPSKPLVCLGDGQPITRHDPILIIHSDTLTARLVVLAGVNIEMCKDAKTIRFTLTRDSLDEEFRGLSFQCIEYFTKDVGDESEG